MKKALRSARCGPSSTINWKVRTLKAPLPTIINLDYLSETDDAVMPLPSLDDAYVDVDAPATLIARSDALARVASITIALTATDDLTGGWGPAEALAERVCSTLGHEFKLPA